jgi:hypothetical protein
MMNGLAGVIMLAIAGLVVGANLGPNHQPFWLVGMVVGFEVAVAIFNFIIFARSPK